MSISPAEDVATYFQTQGLGTYGANGSIMVGEIPDVPTTAIVVRDTPGQTQQDVFEGPVFIYPAVQVAVRGPDLATAATLALNCWRVLAQFKSGTIINGLRYLNIKPIQMPFQMPSDAKGPEGRKLFVFNVDLWSDMR